MTDLSDAHAQRTAYFERRFIRHFGVAPTGMTEEQIRDAVIEHEKAAETATLRGDIDSFLEGTAR